jgi:hypothetical protein
VNERNLSRRLSTSVVEALKSHGHILVVKGGAVALARELEELMAPQLARIAPRIERRAIGGEVTSTFGDEAADEAVEELVVEMTRTLMDSDHVEDVFAEDNVIRRDIFRTLRDGLFQAELTEEPEDEGEPSVKVRLDTLGYVAATASRLAEPKELRDALERAASMVHARFAAYSPEAREATFRLDGGSDDERLELEEAVDDELTDLVEQGLVDLPTVERRIDMGRAFSPAEQRAAGGPIEAAARATILRTGCVAEWEFADPRTLALTFTPLSDQDARDVDKHVAAFARELAAALGARAPKAEPPPRSARGGAAAPASARPKAPIVVDEEIEDEETIEDAAPGDEELDEVEEADEPEEAEPEEAEPEEKATPSKRARATARKGAASTPRAAAARSPASRAPKRATTKRAAKAAEPRARATKAAAAPAKRTAGTAAKARKAPAKKR